MMLSYAIYGYIEAKYGVNILKYLNLQLNCVEDYASCAHAAWKDCKV